MVLLLIFTSENICFSDFNADCGIIDLRPSLPLHTFSLAHDEPVDDTDADEHYVPSEISADSSEEDGLFFSFIS